MTAQRFPSTATHSAPSKQPVVGKDLWDRRTPGCPPTSWPKFLPTHSPLRPASFPLIMSTPSQGLLLSNYKLRGPPAGCPLGTLASPHPGTHSPALSVGASLPAPQVTLPRVTWVPCPPRPVYQRKEPLYTSSWRSLKTCSLRLLSLPFQPTHEQSHHLGACTRCAPIPRSCPLAPAPYKNNDA